MFIIALFHIKNMQDKKLKILVCNEASFLSTGYAVYGKELLGRLSKNPRFHVAELACYGFVNDTRDTETSWRYYANAVRNNDPRFSEYSLNLDNQFGKWRFEKTLLDFRPDVVIDIRDYWMNSYQAYSPMRQCYHWMIMPTVDSYPQQEQWLDTYSGADSVFTYSDWARDVLQSQTSRQINYIDTASPGIDTTKYRILESNQVRSSLKIGSDNIIIGSVMRNQKRKLIPELIKSTRLLIDKLESESSGLAEKVFLYLHTGYPDYLGWDIPSILKENRMLNRTLFTYLCKNCGKIFSDVYSGSHRSCVHCKGEAAFPTVTDGVTQDQMISIFNAFDIYVQYSICEGFGMPQVEAAACGVPIVTIPYSAMEDIVNKIEAYPVNIATLFKELETQAYRAYPDNNSLVEILSKFIRIPYPMRFQKRIKTRNLCIEHFNWDNIIKKWEHRLEYILEEKNKSPLDKYDMFKKKPLKPLLNLQDIISSPGSDLTKLSQICSEYLNDTYSIDSYFILNILQKLKNGFQMENQKITPYDWKNAVDYFNTIIGNNNTVISFLNRNETITEDFIEYSKLKDPKHE
jgi:glycosyltransferase involved in cell wall biosynthesis